MRPILARRNRCCFVTITLLPILRPASCVAEVTRVTFESSCRVFGPVLEFVMDETFVSGDQ